MAKCTIAVKRKITLELEEKEASFLAGYLQNWPYSDQEPHDIHEMRREIFTCLISRKDENGAQQ